MSFSITKNGITVSGDKMVEVFKELADLQEIFSNDQCGKCKNKELKFIVRSDKDENEYYELHCGNSKCRARFAFGQMKGKEGKLFPKRKDKEGNWLPDGGWVRWDRDAGKEV